MTQIMSVSTFFQQDSYMSNTSRSLISGFVGGLAGTAVKSIIEQFLPVRKIEQRSAQIKIVDDLSTKITGSPVSVQNEALAEQLVNLPVGGSLGAAYGYGKKDRHGLRPMDGVIFGATTWASTHETSLPILGLEPKPTDIPVKMQLNELFAHVAFGVTTELVRHYLEKQLRE
jgi:putative membrane protein